MVKRGLWFQHEIPDKRCDQGFSYENIAWHSVDNPQSTEELNTEFLRVLNSMTLLDIPKELAERLDQLSQKLNIHDWTPTDLKSTNETTNEYLEDTVIPKITSYKYTKANVIQQLTFNSARQAFIQKQSTKEINCNNNNRSHALLSPNGILYHYYQNFCRRCYRYGCINHEKYQNVCSADKQSKLLKNEESCSADCYLDKSSMALDGKSLNNRNNGFDTWDWNSASIDLINDDRNNNNILSKYHKKLNADDKKNHNKLSKNSIKEIAKLNVILRKQLSKNLRNKWSEYEKSLTKEILRVFPGNYCAIAGVVTSKTCIEVMMFAKCIPFWYENEDVSILKSKKIKAKKKKMPSYSEDEEQIDYKYYPCDHPTEECDLNNVNCWCVQLNYPCEKYCSCANNCTHRFTGCSCKGNCNSNGNCKCFKMNRECDPDRCYRCHSDIDPQCKNDSLQRDSRAHILIGRSDISGWGAFCKDAVKKGSLLAEYTGEIVSVEESENRGDFYKENKCSYLFELNEEENVDAFLYGNEIRFANHSKTGNSYSQIMKVNGEHRVGIYANRNIEAEEEILFDYGEHFLHLHPELIETIMV